MNKEERLAGADPVLGIDLSATPAEAASVLLERVRELQVHEKAMRVAPPAARLADEAGLRQVLAGRQTRPAAKSNGSRTTPARSPEDAALILERQLASCATLIDALTDYVMRDDSTVDACFGFLDRISSLLESSAAAGKVVGRLRGQVSQTRHTMVMDDRRAGNRGEGVRNRENECVD